MFVCAGSRAGAGVCTQTCSFVYTYQFNKRQQRHAKSCRNSFPVPVLFTASGHYFNVNNKWGEGGG